MHGIQAFGVCGFHKVGREGPLRGVVRIEPHAVGFRVCDLYAMFYLQILEVLMNVWVLWLVVG